MRDDRTMSFIEPLDHYDRKHLQGQTALFEGEVPAFQLGVGMRCYQQVNTGRWCQEWYETRSCDAHKRVRQLRACGYTAKSSAMGNQVTSVGRVAMTLVDIRPGVNPDTTELPGDSWSLIRL